MALKYLTHIVILKAVFPYGCFVNDIHNTPSHWIIITYHQVIDTENKK